MVRISSHFWNIELGKNTNLKWIDNFYHEESISLTSYCKTRHHSKRRTPMQNISYTFYHVLTYSYRTTHCHSYWRYHYLITNSPLRFWICIPLYETVPTSGIHTRFFLIRKPLFYLSLNFLNFSRSRAWDFLKFFLTFTEINWPKWFAISLLIL